MTAGIYKIENTKNGKIYIGMSTNIEARFIQHKTHLRNNHHHNKGLQADWNSFIEDVFEFSVIEIIDLISDLRTRELFYIKLHDNAIYNSSPTYNRLSISKKQPITIELNPSDKLVLQKIAKSLGYIQKTGSDKGSGSISALMQAIAKNEVVLKKG